MILRISEAAASKLGELQGNEVLKISVESGGCHGFQYKLNIEEQSDKDLLFTYKNARVSLDELSFQLLDGSKLDYTQELAGSTFEIVENPLAVSGCGCGISFNVDLK